jgi:hypothetical protein
MNDKVNRVVIPLQTSFLRVLVHDEKADKEVIKLQTSFLRVLVVSRS